MLPLDPEGNLKQIKVMCIKPLKVAKLVWAGTQALKVYGAVDDDTFEAPPLHAHSPC